MKRLRQLTIALCLIALGACLPQAYAWTTNTQVISLAKDVEQCSADALGLLSNVEGMQAKRAALGIDWREVHKQLSQVDGPDDSLQEYGVHATGRQLYEADLVLRNMLIDVGNGKTKLHRATKPKHEIP